MGADRRGSLGPGKQVPSPEAQRFGLPQLQRREEDVKSPLAEQGKQMQTSYGGLNKPSLAVSDLRLRDPQLLLLFGEA